MFPLPVHRSGRGSLRIEETYRVDPNELRALPDGVAWVVNGGRAARVAVAQAPTVATVGEYEHDPDDPARPNAEAPRSKPAAASGEEAWLA